MFQRENDGDLFDDNVQQREENEESFDDMFER